MAKQIGAISEPGNMTDLEIDLIIAGIVLGIGGITVWYAYSQGKKTTTLAPVPYDTDPTGAVTNKPADAMLCLQLAGQLHDDLTSFVIFGDGHNDALYQQVNGLSNTDIITISNDYNTHYEGQDGKTLLQMLQSKWTSFLAPSFTSESNTLIARLESLNQMTTN